MKRTEHRRLALRGETVSTIINRMELAQPHIKTERRSLTETAQLLGFSGLPTFSRFGSSATTWRKNRDAGSHAHGAGYVPRRSKEMMLENQTESTARSCVPPLQLTLRSYPSQ